MVNPISTYHCKTILPNEIIEAEHRTIATEIPISISYNGIAHAVMMITPCDLEDFLTGFTLSESIVASSKNIEEIEIRETDQGLLAHIQIPQEDLRQLVSGRRNIVGQSGCGICGQVELENVIRPLPMISRPKNISASAIFRALQHLENKQTLNEQTASVHGAAFATLEGNIIALREDIGRHNAFDKLIGHLDRNNIDTASGFALLTSRCSYELVQKAAIAKISILASISLPTSLALDIAKDVGLTLIALARSDSLKCFNDPHNLFT